MPTERPPTIAPVAAARWARAAPPRAPWLHEEVGRRMEERLEWIRRSPQAWAHWEALRGGLETHRRVAKRYPQAACHVVEADAGREVLARRALASSWWRRGPPLHVGEPPAGSVQMLWSNMHLHMLADPQATMLRWHRALAPEGFLMFSCLGPDTLKSLRTLYATLGWPPPTQDFTDMHDWGDLLVESGFGEPVMDMERVRLAYDTPAQALAELGELGTNLHPGRFGALRARGWRQALEAALEGLRPPGGGAIELDFEIVYGHALRPLPRPRMLGESAVSVDDMRTLLRGGRPGGAASGGTGR